MSKMIELTRARDDTDCEQQRVAGQEESDQQTGLGEYDREQSGIAEPPRHHCGKQLDEAGWIGEAFKEIEQRVEHQPWYWVTRRLIVS